MPVFRPCGDIPFGDVSGCLFFRTVPGEGGWVNRETACQSGYRQAGCFAIGRNPVRSSVPVLLSVIFLCLDKACLAKWFMLEGPGFQVVRELVFREAV